MIEFLSAGALNTVQDLGRYGHRKIGITIAGAMDKLALSAGNLLLGNPVNSAGIEITMFPFRVRFDCDTSIAISGADCTATLDGRAVMPWWATPVRNGQVLVLSAPQRGSRVYLTLQGGIDVPLVLGSRSTDLKAQFGGHEGRALTRGDRLGLLEGNFRRDPLAAGYGVEPPHVGLPFVPYIKDTLTVRAVPAGEHDKFTKSGQAQFWDSSWLITTNSNRQGYRLAGPALPVEGQSELLSHGLVPGTIQVPPSGQPIVQMSDANTSGGYPKIATVIEADMWRLGQARLGESLCFVQATVEEAVAALITERTWLTRIKASVASLHETQSHRAINEAS